MIKKYNEDWNTFEDYLKANEAPSDESTNVVFDTKNYEIIGLPSGQVIYMDIKQTEYFKSRGVVKFIKVWKKPLDNGYVMMSLKKYCFDDDNYDDIIELMDAITW